MDEQTSPEIVPDTPPAGEANAAVPLPEPESTEHPAVEPVQETPSETPIEPLSTAEITPEISTAEPITERPQGSLPFSKTDDRQENLVVGTAQMAGSEPLPPQSGEEIPTPEPVPEAPAPTTEVAQPEAAPTQTPGSTAPTPGSVAEPLLAPEQTMVAPTRNIARLLLEKAKATILLRKQKKLLKIMTLFEKKDHITNDEVEKLLHVSDATATRYLSELEKQGRIVQHGKTGHAVSYMRR